MIRIEPFGAEALLLDLADTPDVHLPGRIAALAACILDECGELVSDLVPSWTSLLLHYDLLRTHPEQLIERLTPLIERWQGTPPGEEPVRLHELPVWYAGEDLADVAVACGISVAEVIALHSDIDYRVGAIGFAPGFAYLGELDVRLALPRRATPRTRVPAGSLAIAERQTAVYPQASPGGWHLLGLCPQPLFEAGRTPPCPLSIGDRVRFVPVDESTYRRLSGRP